MAFTTQLRLAQITGSFGDKEGGIVDNLPVAATLGAITDGSGSLVSTVSNLASAIKRINGGAAFSANAAGIFKHATTQFGADGNEFAIAESGNDVSLKGLVNDKDMIFKVLDNSSDVEVFRIANADGSAGSSLRVAADQKLEFRDAGIYMHSDSDGKLKISADGTASDAINIDSAGGVDIDAAGLISLETSNNGGIALLSHGSGDIVLNSADVMTLDSDGVMTMRSSLGDITIEAEANNKAVIVKGDHESGTAIHLDGDATAASIVDIDAGILDIDAGASIDMLSTTSTTILATTTLSLKGNNSATFGDDTQEIVYDGSGNVDFDAVALDIDASGAIDILGGSTLSIDAVDDSNLTVTGAGKHLSLLLAGGGDQNLTISSAGTAADAIDINASAGGIDIDAANEIVVTTTSDDGHISLVSAHTGGVAFHIDANADAASELQIDAGILDIDVTAAATLDAVGIALTAGSGELDLTTTGVLDINANTMDADFTGLAQMTVTSSTDGEHIVLQQLGANDSSIILVAAGTGTQAIQLEASAGGVDIDGSSVVIDALDAGAINIGTSTALTKDTSGINIGSNNGARTIQVGNAASTKVALDAILVDITAVGGGVQIDGAAGSHLKTSVGTLDIQAAGELDLDGATVKLDSAGQMDITAAAALNLISAAYDVNASGVVGIDSDAAMTLGGASIGATADAAGGIQLIGSHAAGEIVIQSAHTAGRALFIDADANAGSIVDIDAGILQIDATGIAGINSGGTLSLGTANSGVAVNIGHAVSEVTIGDNLTVTGDLIVNGDTVTVNVSDLQVEDKMIELNYVAGGTASNIGAGLHLSGSNPADDITFQALSNGGRMELNVDSGVKTGKAFFVHTNNVLSQTTLGSTVLASSLTSVGTIATGVWNAGAITSSGRIVTDDVTDATNSTDGSLQTDGGLSVAKKIFNNTDATLAAVSGIVTMGAATPVTVSAAGVLDIANATPASAIGTAALVVDGGASVAKDIWVGDDIVLDSDGAIINFGDTQGNVTLTHIVDTGLRLNGANKLQFRDAGVFITSDEDTALHLEGDAKVNIAINSNNVLETSATLVESKQLVKVPRLKFADNAYLDTDTTAAWGQIKTNGTFCLNAAEFKLQSDGMLTKWGLNGDVRLGHVHNTGFLISSGTAGPIELQMFDAGMKLKAAADGQLELISDGTLVLSSTLDMTFDANGGQFNFNDGGATHFLMDADATKFEIYDDQDTGDLFRIQVAQHGATTISTIDDDAANAKIELLADGDIVLDAASGLFDLKKAGSDIFQLAEGNAGDITLTQQGNNKDLIFRVKDNNVVTEVARLVGADSVMRFGSGKAIQWNDANEAIWGDSNYLYLKSNNNQFRLPNVQSSGNQILVAESNGNFSWAAAPTDADSRNQQIKESIPELVLSGTTLSYLSPTWNIAPDVSISDSDLDAGMMCFVNGQLLMSGAIGDVGGGKADYHLLEDGKASEFTITFDGTTGDVAANYASGGDGTFELIYFNSEAEWSNVKDGSNNELTQNGGEANGSNNITMSANPAGLAPGDIVSYVNTSGARQFSRVNGTAGNDINLSSTVVAGIANGTKIQIVGRSKQFIFKNADIAGTGDDDGAGKIKICYGANMSPLIGNAGAAEAVAVQLADAVDKAFGESQAVVAKANGLAVKISGNALFKSYGNGVPGLNGLVNFANTPFGSSSYANGTDTGRKTIKFGFDLEADDVIQVSIR